MGRLIDSWIAEELPKLQIMLQPPRTSGPGITQPEGATTFPAQEPGRVNVFTPSGSPMLPPQPTFPQQQGGLPPDWRQQLSQAGRPPGHPSAAPANAASTFEEPAPRRQVAPEDVESFDDLAAAAPEEVDKGIEVITEQLGGEEGVDRAYAQVAGRPPPKGMSRREKGMLLMEFGLRTLAHNTSESGLEAIGKAGVETLVGHRQRQRDEVKDAAEAEDRELRRKVLEAQLNKERTQIKVDRDGNYRIINMQDGTSRMVLDPEGNPIKAGGESAEQFAFDVQRQAFEGAFCEGLTGEALAKCRQNGLLFSKGGNIAELAFPEIGRQRRLDEFAARMLNPDLASVVMPLPNGQSKRWREMNADERRAASEMYVDTYDLQFARNAGARSAAPARSNNWGLTQEQIDSIPEGKRTRLPNGVTIARRGGRVVQIDEQGNEIQ